MKKFILFFLILLLAACASEPKHGFGPLELTSAQQEYFNKYLRRYEKRKEKQAFWALAISPSEGYMTYGASWGGAPGEASQRVQDRQIANCNEEVAAKDCKIYALNGEVVWKFNETANNSLSSKSTTQDRSSTKGELTSAREQLIGIQTLLKQGQISEEEAQKRRNKILDNL